VEKAEKLYRTATVQKIMPTRLTKTDHACAIAGAPIVTSVRSSTARRKIKT
jgi:hypothetical protein